MEVMRFESSYAEPYPLQVQGESQYRENIEDACGYYGEEEGVNADDLIARLILEDENIYDPQNAVRIEIENKTVGYLSKPAAKLYRKKLDELGLKNIVGECYASVKGGFHKRDGTQADFGIRLDIILDELGIKKPTATPVKQEPITQPRKIIQSSIPAATVTTTKPQQILDFVRWAFAPGRWWKTMLIIFFAPPFLCGVIQEFFRLLLEK